MSDNAAGGLCLTALAIAIIWAGDRGEKRAHEAALAKCQMATQNAPLKPSEKAPLLSE
jgi:hypothetical protein